jgi:hypothetical protein
MRTLKPLIYLCTLLAATQLASATQVIANWDVVPGQRISSPFKAGVVAFHESGVDLEFRVNGGSVILVDEPTYNDRTRVYEYWFTIDPADYPDGAITVSATALPEGSGHQSRVLETLQLYANAGGSLDAGEPVWVATSGSDINGDGSENNPYASIRTAVLNVEDGGIIYLKAALNYKLSNIGGAAFTYWTTVSAAPGLSSDEVQIAGELSDDSTTSRYNQSGIKWQNVGLYRDGDDGGDVGIFYPESDQRWWLDRVQVFDKGGRLVGGRIYNSNSQSPYITNSYIHDLSNVFGNFHRNNRIERIGADIFRSADNLTAINIEINTMDHGNTSAHPDFFQLYSPDETAENILLYNVQCTDMDAQGIFGGAGTAKDLAFVNVLLEKDPSTSLLMSQNAGDWHHVLLWHVTLVDQAYLFRESAEGILDYNIRNSIFDSLVIENTGATQFPDANSTIESNHIKQRSYQQSAPMGTLSTEGDPMYVDESADDYRLQLSSPAAGTGSTIPGVPADIFGVPYHSSHRNRGALSANNPGDRSFDPSVSAQITAVLQDYDPETSSSQVATTFSGRPHARFKIEASSDLINWSSLPRLFSNIDGQLNLNEQLPNEAPQRFFRVTEDDFPWRAVVDTPTNPGSGRIVTQTIHNDDRILFSDGTTRWVSDTTARVGNGYASGQASVYVLPVQLPALQSGEFISAAKLSIQLSGWNNHNALSAVDLYGITFEDSASTVDDSRYFVDGSNSISNPDALRLQDNFAHTSDINDTSEGAADIQITSIDFAAHVESLYAGGAQAGDFMFLILTHDSTLTLQRYYTFGTSDSSSKPEVEFVISQVE